MIKYEVFSNSSVWFLMTLYTNGILFVIVFLGRLKRANSDRNKKKTLRARVQVLFAGVCYIFCFCFIVRAGMFVCLFHAFQRWGWATPRGHATCNLNLIDETVQLASFAMVEFLLQLQVCLLVFSPLMPLSWPIFLSLPAQPSVDDKTGSSLLHMLGSRVVSWMFGQ